MGTLTALVVTVLATAYSAVAAPTAEQAGFVSRVKSLEANH